MVIKHGSLNSQKLGFLQFCQIANTDPIKVKPAMFPLFRGADLLLSGSNELNLLESLLRTQIRMTQISLYLITFLELIWNCIIFQQVPQYLIWWDRLIKFISNLGSSLKSMWFQLYSNGSSKRLRAWNSIQIRWSFQYQFEEILFFRLWFFEILESFVCGPCIYENVG